MQDRLPLSALMSQAFVAFTIEFDNEFEHLVPHRTTNHGSADGSAPWLVSMVMWLQILRFVPQQGIAARELHSLTDLSQKEFRMWLTRLSQWWSYIAVSGMTVTPTPGGLKALEAWRPLTAKIEQRWRERFGSLTDLLVDVMRRTAARVAPGFPDYLPVLGYELLTAPPRARMAHEDTLPGLLAQLLRAFAIEFERESGLSIAVYANLLRITGVPIRDLPRFAGVSKEAMAMLRRRAKELGLREEYGDYLRLTANIERDWDAEGLRELLEHIVGHGDFRQGLKPYPEGWRATVSAMAALPHYPMVLHRGGFPDGS